MGGNWFDRSDRLLEAVLRPGRWLVVPVSLLLFLQWPLRDVVGGYSSREANDLAQWLFALYVSLAVSFASRRRTHLAATALAQRYRPLVRLRIGRAGALVCLLPWALFILVAGAPAAWSSLAQFERFPDTFNPGYFVIKAGVWLMAFLVALQALLDLLRPAAEAGR